jgi:hypothetical protein
MANDVSSKVIFGIDVNEFRRGIAKVDNSIKGISRQFQNLGGLIGASFAVGQIQQFGKEAIQLSGQLEKAAAGFARFGEEADLQMMRKQTRGLVTDIQLMQQTVKGANLGIPFRDMGVLLEFAKRRADETGESIENLIGSIIEGVGRKSTRRLDNLGISADRLKEKVGGISLEMANVADVSRAMVEIANEELGKMGDPVDTATDKIQRMYVAWENFKASIGGPISGEVANFLEKLSLTFAPGQGGGGLSQAIRGVGKMIGTGGQFPQMEGLQATRAQGIFGAFPIEPPTEIVKTAEQLKAEQEAITRQYEKQWEIMQNQLALYAQMQTQVEETFKKELLEGFTALQLDEIDLLEGEMVPILEQVREKFDNVNLVAQQFGSILTNSFGAALQSGESFFEVVGKALKAYVQQLIAATAATVALAAISSAFGGGTFLSAFAKVGQGTGLAGFLGGDQEFTGRVKGFELLLQQNRTNRNVGLINGN